VWRSHTCGVDGTTKNDEVRHQPLAGVVAVALAALSPRHPDARVFCSDQGLPLDSNRVRASMRFGIRVSGVPRIRFHDLRHSFASMLVMNDVSLYQVQKLLGHRNHKTTQRYAHLSPNAQAGAVAALEEKLG
jgi:site-specific recombinase XerD